MSVYLFLPSNNHGYPIAEHAERGLDHDIRTEIFSKLLHLLSGEVFMGIFASSEAHFKLNLIPVIEELERLLFSGILIVLADFKGQADALQFNLLLVSFGLAFLLFELELEGAIVQDFTNRRTGHRCNFNKVQSFILGQSEGSTGVHDTERVACIVDHRHLRNADEVIDSITFFGNCFRSY